MGEITTAVTQREQVLEHLTKCGPLTTIAAVYEMHVLHPANAIHQLRLAGENIVTVLRPSTLPNGKRTVCGEYHLLDKTVAVSDMLQDRGVGK